MKNLRIFIFAIVLITSCSKTDQQLELINITGKLLAPNGMDPISKAKVILLSNGIVKQETTTNSMGEFTLETEVGNYTIQVRKGLFSVQREVSVDHDYDFDSIVFDSFPKIGVVTGHYDNIEHILADIGLVHPVTGQPLFDIIEGIDTSAKIANTHNSGHASHQENKSNLLPVNVNFDFHELVMDPNKLAEYDILFLNCGLREASTGYNANLKQFVQNGGILYATDWAFVYLNEITNDNTNYLQFLDNQKSGVSLQTTATITDSDLIDWLSQNFGISINETVHIDEFLQEWQVVDSFDPNTTKNWLNGPIEYRDNNNVVVSENKDLAFSFALGSGGVFYSSFHTENSNAGFTHVDRLMEYFVFELAALGQH